MSGNRVSSKSPVALLDGDAGQQIPRGVTRPRFPKLFKVGALRCDCVGELLSDLHLALLSHRESDGMERRLASRCALVNSAALIHCK